MRISDIPEYKDRDHVFSMDHETLLSEAVRHMSNMNYGSVVVTENGKLAGIVTERDIMKRVVNENLRAGDIKLGDIMTRDIKVAKSTDLVTDSLRRMSQGKFRHLPIVDENEKLVGLVSQGDFIAYTWPQIMHRVSENAKASIMSGYQPLLIVVAVLIYSLFLFSAVG